MIGILTLLDVVSIAASWKPQMAQKGRWRKEETQASDGVFLMSVNKMCYKTFERTVNLPLNNSIVIFSLRLSYLYLRVDIDDR